MDVEVDLGLASQFVSYDNEIGRMSIIENKLNNAYAGDYSIQVTAFIRNETYSESHSQAFTLKVIPKYEEVEEKMQDVVKIDKDGTVVPDPYYSFRKDKKEYKKVVTTELGPYNPYQPIPRIKKLTPAGLL